MTDFELQAKIAWKLYAANIRFGLCATCKRTHNDDGTPLLVARQERCSRYECLACWDLGEAVQEVAR